MRRTTGLTGLRLVDMGCVATVPMEETCVRIRARLMLITSRLGPVSPVEPSI